MPRPPRVQMRWGDTARPEFPEWEYQEGAVITVVDVRSDLVGPLPANMNPVWKFSDHGRGSAGMGVAASLDFDEGAAVPPHCIPFYREVLWPQHSVLTLTCAYPGGRLLPLEVELV